LSVLSSQVIATGCVIGYRGESSVFGWLKPASMGALPNKHHLVDHARRSSRGIPLCQAVTMSQWKPERKASVPAAVDTVTPPPPVLDRSREETVLSEDDVQNYLVSHPHVLVAALEAAINRYHEALPVAEQILDLVRLGVLAGLIPRHQVVQFLVRLSEGADEKQRLAEFCLSRLNKLIRTAEDGKQFIQKGRHFFECGSTIAYLIGALARLIEEKGPGKPLPHPEVLTNNLLSLTAFIGLIERVEHLRGRLDPKYFGFLPFRDEDPEDGDGEDEAAKVEEIVREIKQCSSAFVTCSNFSFLAGPVVGSRANALVKRSIHYGKQMWGREANHSYFLLFHFAKIIPILPPVEQGEDQCFDRPKLRCRPVFAAPQRLSLPPKASEAFKPVSAAGPDAAVDGPTWHHYLLAANKVIRCPAAELDEKIKQHDRENHRPYPLDLGGTWIDDLSQGTRILIGLPHDHISAKPKGYEQAYQILQNEVATATEIIREARPHNGRGAGDKYEIVTRLDELDKTNGVVEIRVH
jgi:hypothetical protein